MEKYLHRCLDSLLAQDIPQNEYEIIIVNDESKDKTLQIAKGYSLKHDNILICDKKNGGVGAARNAGLNMAKGTYVHFVDPDDYVAKNVYKTLIDFADDKKLDILNFLYLNTSETNLIDSETNINQIDLEQVKIKDGVTFISENNYRNPVWWYLINREFLNSTGLKFIEGRWMEDTILTPQLFIKAERMAKIPLDVYRYMITSNSAMISKEPEHYNKLIGDFENAIFVLNDIIKSIPDSGLTNDLCKNRIITRQQSFVFFLLVRLMKSNLPIKHIVPKLESFKKINAYPLNNFISKEFNGFSYYFLTFIFNREKLMYPFMRLFRYTYKPLMKIISK